MANILRIYDFEFLHREKNKKVTFFDFANSHSELQELIKVNSTQSENLKWAIIIDAVKHKLSNDLNKEKLKNSTTQKIVKRGYTIDKNKKITLKEINIDKNQFLIYSTLNGGKITDKSIIEKVSIEEDSTYQLLSGDRIYDEMFFLLHVSFRCNKARLFTLNRSNNYNLDTIIKSYFEKDMFKSAYFIKGKWHPFVPEELRTEALNRTIINNISISKNEYLNSEELDDEFEIEIKLKSKNKGGFGKITKELVNMFKKTHIIANSEELEDESGIVKFNITDPETKTNKSVTFGDTDDFYPKLVYTDIEVSQSDLRLDEEKIKNICTNYIKYDNNGFI